MRKVPLNESLGESLGHDVTRIVPGKFKGSVFRRGHVVTPEDLPALRELGKDLVWVGEADPGLVHENEAAARLAYAVAGEGVVAAAPREGRANLRASRDGLLVVDRRTVSVFNGGFRVWLVTRHGYTPVKAGETVAAVKVLPLALPGASLEKLQRLIPSRGAVWVRPLRVLKTGVVITGNEVCEGRVPEAFLPAVRRKLEGYGCPVVGWRVVPDVPDEIARAIRELLVLGSEMILATGGMAVDANDVTAEGIRRAGARVVGHGVPVLPGSLTLVAYLEEVPVLGLPACVLYDRVTAFDLLLPRLLAGEVLDGGQLGALGYGGLCAHCEVCVYPRCAFGKG